MMCKNLSTLLALLCLLAGLLRAGAIPPPQPGLVEIDYRSQVSKDDLVYLSPPLHGWEGLPLGDGEAGAILWNPPDRLLFQVNHSALWDDAPAATRGSQPPRNETEQEGLLSVNRHAGRLVIETGLPLFDWKYLRDYEARLNLYDAEAELRAEGSMGSASMNALYSHLHRTLMIEYSDRTRVRTPRKILLERLGSRTIAGWYSRVVQEPEIGLAKTTSGQEGDEFWVQKELGTLSFAVAVLLKAGKGNFAISAVNDYQCVAVSEPSAETMFVLYLAVAHSDETHDPLQLARQRVRRAAEDGPARVRQTHRADWASQWKMAFVDLPEDRYWENLWRIIEYMNISSRRGMHPPYFIHSIWAWNRDVTAWAGSYLHWNMWSPNFSLFPTGHIDLLEPYFAWKKRQLPHAIEYAKQQHGLEGAFFTDYGSRRGEQTHASGNWKYWPIPGLLLAQEYFKYWEYTQDDAFLKQEALPFLRETARFLMNYMEEGEDGKLHIRETVPYEFHGPYQFRDCITEQAMVRWLLPALIRAEEATGSVSELSTRARDVLARLAPIQSGPIHEAWLIEENGNKVYANPFFRGEPYSEGDRVFATGWSTKHKRYVTHMEVGVDPSSRYGVLCGAQVAPVWLAGLVGPDQSPERRDLTGKNSPEDIRMWEMGRNGLRTMRIFPTLQPNPGQRTHSDRHLSWTGHNQDLPAFARLGLRRNLRTAMETYVEKYQITPQGFWNYWPWERWKDGVAHPRGSESGEQIPFPEDPRMIHSSLEPTGIFPVTLAESLMTSYDGVIRLFPAYDRDAGFRLAAKGGFWVASRRTDSTVEFVQIESYAGKDCAISNPWPGKKLTLAKLASGERVAFRQERDRILFATRQGEMYLLTPEGQKAERWRLGGARRTDPHVYRVKVHTNPAYPIDAPGGIKTKVLGKLRDF